MEDHGRPGAILEPCTWKWPHKLETALLVQLWIFARSRHRLEWNVESRKFLMLCLPQFVTIALLWYKRLQTVNCWTFTALRHAPVQKIMLQSSDTLSHDCLQFVNLGMTKTVAIEMKSSELVDSLQEQDNGNTEGRSGVNNSAWKHLWKHWAWKTKVNNIFIDLFIHLYMYLSI